MKFRKCQMIKLSMGIKKAVQKERPMSAIGMIRN